MVGQRSVDTRDGRFQQGEVSPRDATEAYREAASRGLEATVTNNAPALHDGSAVDANRLDLLLVDGVNAPARSEEHTSELQSLMRISYAVFCLKKKNELNCDRRVPSRRHSLKRPPRYQS